MRCSPKRGTKGFREMGMDGKTWADEAHGDAALLWVHEIQKQGTIPYFKEPDWKVGLQ